MIINDILEFEGSKWMVIEDDIIVKVTNETNQYVKYKMGEGRQVEVTVWGNMRRKTNEHGHIYDDYKETIKIAPLYVHN